MCREVSELEYDLLLTVHVERMEAEEITGKYAALLFLNQNKHYPTTKWNRKRYMDLAQLGVGMVFLQFTLSSEPEWDSYHDLVGGKWFLKRYEANAMLHSTYFTDLTLGVKILEPDHPTTAGMKDFTMTDAFYGNIQMAPDVQILLGTDHPDISPTIAWTRRYQNPQIVYLIPGFTEKAYNNKHNRKFLANAIEFARAKE